MERGMIRRWAPAPSRTGFTTGSTAPAARPPRTTSALTLAGTPSPTTIPSASPSTGLSLLRRRRRLGNQRSLLSWDDPERDRYLGSLAQSRQPLGGRHPSLQPDTEPGLVAH